MKTKKCAKCDGTGVDFARFRTHPHDAICLRCRARNLQDLQTPETRMPWWIYACAIISCLAIWFAVALLFNLHTK